MAGLKLQHIYKVYPNGVQAVSDFNIDIEDCEFIVFVGPSGCGKSTTLRMIAGLEDISAGDLYIGDTLVNDIQPKDRDIAMVFQNYALYPHMTVYNNMAFSLKNKHMANDEIHKRVMEAARILDIEDYLPRKPRAMSGGQRQRVSLGRAIVRQPKVFLLDEPLSNLDAKLRAQMRTEITKLHKKLKTTFIYVTHDQVEAMTMGTRIVVMKKGFVQQIDSPTNLYDHPNNKFVAGFIGTPQMNFFDVVLKREHEKGIVTITFADKQVLSLDEKYFSHADKKYLNGDTHVSLGIRPDYLVEGEDGLDFKIINIEALGNETLLYCTLGSGTSESVSITEATYIFRVNPNKKYQIDQVIKGSLVGEKIQLFANAIDDENESTIMPYIPLSSRVKIKFSKDKFTMFGKSYQKFGAFKDALDGEYDVIIPHDSIVPGTQFSLPVYEVTKLGEAKYLVNLYDEKNDTYIFAISNTEPAVGSKYDFGFKYYELKVDEQSGIKPWIKETELVGKFVRKKSGRDIYWDFETLDASYRIRDKVIAKIANIEGRRILKADYRIVFNPLVYNKKDGLDENLLNLVLPMSFNISETPSLTSSYAVLKDKKFIGVSSEEELTKRPLNLELAKLNQSLEIKEVSLTRKSNKVTLTTDTDKATVSADKMYGLSRRYLEEGVKINIAYDKEAGLKKSIEADTYMLYGDDESLINPNSNLGNDIKITVKDGKLEALDNGFETDALEEGENYYYVTPDAFTKGSTFSMKIVANKKLSTNLYLLTLHDEKTDSYLYARVADELEVGSYYRFNINLSRIVKSSEAKTVSVRNVSINKKRYMEVIADGVLNLLGLTQVTIDGLSLPEGYKIYQVYETRTKTSGIKYELVNNLDYDAHKFIHVNLNDKPADIEVEAESEDERVIQILKDGFEVYSTKNMIRLA